MTDATVSAVARPRAVPSLHDAAVGAGVGLAVAALAAADGGYFPTAWGWGALGALWVVAAVLLAGAIRRPSVLQLIFLGSLGAFTAWVWLSAAWSIDSVEALLEGQRALLYLATAAALVLVLRGRSVTAALGGAVIGISLAAAYGLGTRLLPDRLGVFDPLAGYRLSEPVGYWNGLGILLAIGVLLTLGFAARGRAVAVRAGAGGLLVLLLPTIYFTFARGPWVALGLGLAAAVALDPRRLQLLAVTLTVGAPAALGVLAASQYEALRREDAPLALAAREGHRLALILALLVVAGAAAGAVVALAERRIDVPRRVRIGFAAVLALCAVVAVAVGLVVAGGPVTLAEKGYDAFDAPPPHTEGDLGERLLSFSGSYRADVWASAWRDYREHPLLGSGAGSFEQHWQQDRSFLHEVRDAHSLYIETLAELGPLGLALLLAAFGAPLAAALLARREPLASAAFAAFVAYVVHAAVDWDLELPAVTVTALVCAAVLLAAARGDERTLEVGLWARGAAVAATLAIAAVAFVSLAANSALAASDEALEAERWSTAADEARKAKRWAPWSSKPFHRLGDAHLGQGSFELAASDYREAIEREPGDFELWLGLAAATDGAERQAALARATELNPLSPEIEEFRAG